MNNISHLKIFSFAIALIIIQTALFGILSISEKPTVIENKYRFYDEDIIENELYEENQKSLLQAEIKETLEKEEKPESYNISWVESLPEIESEELKSFSSYEEFKEYVNFSRYYPRYYTSKSSAFESTKSNEMNLGSGVKTTDYSSTNVQVKGVDEADIIKTDGEYIYTVSDGNVVIVKAYPSSELLIVSEIITYNYINEIFLNNDKLVIFESNNNNYYSYYYDRWNPYYYHTKTLVKVYDIYDKYNPILTQNISISGNYQDSRMIGDYIYVITKQNIYTYLDNITMPFIESDNEKRIMNATEIKYFNDTDSSYSFSNLLSVNVNKPEINYRVFLLSSQEMYVSPGNIYLTYSRYYNGNRTTIINRFSINNGTIRYTGIGRVPGRIVNQFSMDEYNCHFRIATTTGQVSRNRESTSLNHLFILDEYLNIIGKVEDLAKGEKIYSARFMGKRAYIVTFKKVDPLFVIDVEIPQDPKVLGYLKITGYSDYLHPYDENHIIGIGKETRGGGEHFSYYQGVKISLFNVSDVSNPIENAKIEIGDRGTDSEALREHKAVLFSKRKNLLVLPIKLSIIDESKYQGEIPDNTRGETVFRGAFVLNINKNSISERGRITHNDNDQNINSYYYYNGNTIRRSLYINDNLYTISNNMIKVHDLKSINEIGNIEIKK